MTLLQHCCSIVYFPALCSFVFSFQGRFLPTALTPTSYKHLWLFTAGRWLHDHLPYSEVPPAERVPITFRRGYVWTQGPHVDARSLERIDILREKVDPKWNQNRLLSPVSLEKYNWFSLSSTSDYAHDRPRTARPGEVTVASRMLDPVVHYRARTVVTAEVATTSDRSVVPREVPVAITHGLQSGSSSLGTWGQRITDKDMNLLLGQLFPIRGFRIEESTMFDRRGSKRLSDQDMIAQLLQKEDILEKDIVPVLIGLYPKPTTSRASSDPPEARASSSREDQPVAVVSTSMSRWEDSKAHNPSASDSRAEPIRLKSSAQKALMTKFDDKLTSEAICLSFSGNAAAWGYTNRIEEKVSSMGIEARRARSTENKAEEKVKAVEEKLEHSRYLQEVLPVALDQARLQAVEEYQNSAEFNARLLAEYNEEMRDMKADFAMTKPIVTGVDWSFVPEVSGETVAEEGEA
ncbi:hypothetical protein TIFTF001_020133 [Ficus carica]|uniref:Uncharacterized protein n=1 Tax=Ficus carica TaxID=3494 RepID=A0AA88DCC9_FICCA|nr:hypothetical protein TIFTF001_020133 [Ficus carica]